MNLKLNFRFSIPSEWTLYELQQAQKHAWRRQPAPTSAWSEPRCRSCHETKISQKWDILPKSGGISHFWWDIPLWSLGRDCGISTGLGYLTLHPVKCAVYFVRQTAGVGEISHDASLF